MSIHPSIIVTAFLLKGCRNAGAYHRPDAPWADLIFRDTQPLTPMQFKVINPPNYTSLDFGRKKKKRKPYTGRTCKLHAENNVDSNPGPASCEMKVHRHAAPYAACNLENINQNIKSQVFNSVVNNN